MKASKPPPTGPGAISLDDIESSFDALLDPSQPRSDATAPSPSDLLEVEELFRQIAASHLSPLRDFMIELELGDPARSWVDVCLPAVASLSKSAVSMELKDLSAALSAVSSALELSRSGEGGGIDPAARDLLVTSYADLIKLLPDAFSVREERDRREPIIVRSLLEQVEGVRTLALEKLFGAGLTSLGMYYAARPSEIAETTGLDLPLAERIVKQFREYRERTQTIVPDLGRSAEHAELRALVEQLTRLNEEFESQSKSWAKRSAAEKRRVRNERTDTVLKVNVVLARLGEVDLVGELEKLPFARKVEQLGRFLKRVEQRKSGG